MNNSKLNFNITPSDPQHPLGVEIWVNDQQLFNYEQVTETQPVHYEFNDDVEQAYQLKIVIKNKTDEYTEVSAAGEIIKDSLLDINNFKLDDIDIDQIVRTKAVYRHDFNGSGQFVDDQFYNTVGCNGAITFEFATPGYLWLLENM